MRPEDFKKRKYTPSLSELAAKKKQKTQFEEMAAISVSAIVTNLQKLRVEVVRYFELLNELYPKVCKHLHDAGFTSSHNPNDEFTFDELLELQTNQQLPPELQVMLDQYVAVQQQVAMLEQQIQEAEKQIELFQLQQDEIRQEIQQTEQKQAELTEQTVNDVHKELSNRVTEAPSKEKLAEAYANDIKAEDLQTMSSDVREFVEQSFHEQHQNDPSLLPSLKPASSVAVKKDDGKEEVEEEHQNVVQPQEIKQQEQPVEPLRFLARSLNVVNMLFPQSRPRHEYQDAMSHIVPLLVRAELQHRAYEAAIDAATHRWSQMNDAQAYLVNKVMQMQMQSTSARRDLDNLEHLFQSTYGISPRRF